MGKVEICTVYSCDFVRRLPVSGSGLCQIASRGINGVESSGFITTTVYLATCVGYVLRATPAERRYFVIKLHVIELANSAG